MSPLSQQFSAGIQSNTPPDGREYSQIMRGDLKELSGRAKRRALARAVKRAVKKGLL